jgi:transcriptional regulator with XRE-family HTH domain
MARQHEIISKADKFIGDKIFQLRLGLGLSRQELAKIINVTHQQLQKYEKGTNRVSAGRLLLIANALGQDVQYFYQGFDESAKDVISSTQHQRMCLELSKNFMKITEGNQQNAVSNLVKSLAQ